MGYTKQSIVARGGGGGGVVYIAWKSKLAGTQICSSYKSCGQTT